MSMQTEELSRDQAKEAEAQEEVGRKMESERWSQAPRRTWEGHRGAIANEGRAVPFVISERQGIETAEQN